jgi:hypothetical protein
MNLAFKRLLDRILDLILPHRRRKRKRITVHYLL